MGYIWAVIEPQYHLCSPLVGAEVSNFYLCIYLFSVAFWLGPLHSTDCVFDVDVAWWSAIVNW